MSRRRNRDYRRKGFYKNKNEKIIPCGTQVRSNGRQTSGISGNKEEGGIFDGVSVCTLVLAFFFSIGGVGTNLFIILLERCQVLTSLREFTLDVMNENEYKARKSCTDFLHTLTNVPVHEGTFGIHEIEFVICRPTSVTGSRMYNGQHTKTAPGSGNSSGAVKR
jgi:hypothetical protein